MNLTLEAWRDIPGWEGYYQASSWGQIKSLARMVNYSRKPGFRSLPERILQLNVDDGGRTGKVTRLVVSLSRDSKEISRSVHQLVLETFVGPRPEGFDGCHNDGDPTNNRLDNLRWGTRMSNIQDMIAHGTYPHGEKGPANLTESQVLEIRASAGMIPQKDLAKQFGVTKSNISAIITRKSWTHI